MYYVPRLANGDIVQNPWSLRILKGTFICWPLEDNASLLARFLDRLYLLFGFLLFLQHNEAEFRFLRLNFNNIDELLSGVPTYLVLLEIHLRFFKMALEKEEYKKLLKSFYSNVYIEESSNPKVFKRIVRKMRLTSYISVQYWLTLSLFVYAFIMNLISNRHEPLYKMTFTFDHTPYYIYFPIVLGNLWVGSLCVIVIVGDLNMLSQIVLHMDERFQMLRKDLEQWSHKLLKDGDPETIAQDFQEVIKGVYASSVELYRFGAEAQVVFTYRIFIWFAFSAGLLCTLCFKFYINTQDFISFFWAFCKVLELGAIGEHCSTLIKTTDEASQMYYFSNWELVIQRSTNTRENVRLMKLIFLAMENTQKTIYFTGLNFFNASLHTGVMILRGAGSYFTCLISLR